jgi:hypothetical protein
MFFNSLKSDRNVTNITSELRYKQGIMNLNMGTISVTNDSLRYTVFPVRAGNTERVTVSNSIDGVAAELYLLQETGELLVKEHADNKSTTVRRFTGKDKLEDANVNGVKVKYHFEKYPTYKLGKSNFFDWVRKIFVRKTFEDQNRWYELLVLRDKKTSKVVDYGVVGMRDIGYKAPVLATAAVWSDLGALARFGYNDLTEKKHKTTEPTNPDNPPDNPPNNPPSTEPSPNVPPTTRPTPTPDTSPGVPSTSTPTASPDVGPTVPTCTTPETPIIPGETGPTIP